MQLYAHLCHGRAWNLLRGGLCNCAYVTLCAWAGNRYSLRICVNFAYANVHSSIGHPLWWDTSSSLEKKKYWAYVTVCVWDFDLFSNIVFWLLINYLFFFLSLHRTQLLHVFGEHNSGGQYCSVPERHALAHPDRYSIHWSSQPIDRVDGRRTGTIIFISKIVFFSLEYVVSVYFISKKL